MKNSVRDNLESGEVNLANKVDGRDMTLLYVDHQSKYQNQTKWNHTGLLEDPKKVLQNLFSFRHSPGNR